MLYVDQTNIKPSLIALGIGKFNFNNAGITSCIQFSWTYNNGRKYDGAGAAMGVLQTSSGFFSHASPFPATTTDN